MGNQNFYSLKKYVEIFPIIIFLCFQPPTPTYHQIIGSETKNKKIPKKKLTHTHRHNLNKQEKYLMIKFKTKKLNKKIDLVKKR